MRALLNKETAKRSLIYLLIALILFITLVPIYWLVIVSLSTKKDLYGSPTLIPKSFNINNFIEPFVEGEFSSYLINSLIVATANTLLVLLITIHAAYGLSRFKIYGAKHLFFYILTNRMAPPAVFILPVFLIFALLRLHDTLFSLILVYCVFNVPLAIWMLRGAIDNIPMSLEHCARVDGYSIGTIIRKIIIPLAKPSIVVTGFLVWLFAWNHYIFAMILTSTRARVITTGLTEFVTTMGTNWGQMAAVSLVCMAPAFILLSIIQRHIITGLTFGAVKR